MKLVTCAVTYSPAPLYRLKDSHSGITYPNLLTSEQIQSPAVVEAARTYIAMRQVERVRAHAAALSPFAVSVMDFIGLTGSRSGRLSDAKPETDVLIPGERLLLDKIEQLQRANASLQERNDRQARIIKAVQGAVRGDVQ
ncbi:hypothetical protein P2_0018 [Aeromonas phage P2]|uniref:Uncharacterized protein n=1 Tax=Aeromonas phage P2 TaxID=2996101 RepID=A0A9E8GBP1_9CAUD|nr:hypothetical protein P2_0018 [Aeromonas phage P2]